MRVNLILLTVLALRSLALCDDCDLRGVKSHFKLEPLPATDVEVGYVWKFKGDVGPDHPLMDSKERKLAHSDKFVFPRITAPPARRLAVTVESRTAGFPSSANEPAVVCIPSPASTLSLRSTGIPCKGPTGAADE
jgi:hypothetical protein